MATKSGRIASVKITGTKVAGMGTWSFSGFTRELIEEDSWDLDIKKKHFSVGDAGTLTFSGLHDPADASQITLNSACINSSNFTSGNIRFYIDNTSYWTIAIGGTILITKVESITMEKSAMGTVDFEAAVQGAEMVLI
jgi:hypothetical protein